MAGAAHRSVHQFTWWEQTEVPNNSGPANPATKRRSHCLAVCANRVLVSLDKSLLVYDLESGNNLQKIDLPASVPIEHCHRRREGCGQLQ